MFRRLSCAKTGLPIMPQREASDLGLPELARVCVVFEDNSRLDHLVAVEGLSTYGSDLYGEIDLSAAFDENVVRVVIDEFADADLNYYDLAFNDADECDPAPEVVRERLSHLRAARPSPAVRGESAARMMA